MTASSKTTITVPLLDLKAQYETLRDEIEPVVRDVIESQWFIGGPNVSQLEEDISRYCRASHAVGCASGSDAILLALQTLGVGPGHYVACPTYSFFATAGSISRLGAKPLLVDIDPGTYNMDPHSLEAALSSVSAEAVKAIMPVHLFGQCCDMDAITEIASSRNLPIIEDAAQALGAEDVHGRRAGSMAHAGCFSFFPSKNLGGFGDGGIVTFQTEESASQAARLRNHGMNPKYYHAEIGSNSRLDALQAAVLIVKLRHLDAWTQCRRENARFYDEVFQQAGALTSDLSLNESTDIPLRFPLPAPDSARHIYNQYIVRVPASHRDLIRSRLAEVNIGTEVYYPLSLHQQDCYRDLDTQGRSFDVSELAATETISIPVYPDLSIAQKTHVAESLIAIVRAL